MIILLRRRHLLAVLYLLFTALAAFAFLHERQNVAVLSPE